MTKTSAIVAGVCGALFMAYCVYFDRKRRNDPFFKEKLRERRKKQKKIDGKCGLAKFPDLKEAGDVESFFLEEIHLAGELMSQGDFEKAADHLVNAIAVCPQPQQLLQVLQQTMPSPVLQIILTKLPTISQKIIGSQSVMEDVE